jgi:CDP-glucose 4,6-dehydratase
MPAEVNAGHWLDRSVLVTGGTGLAGSWLVRRLLELHANVVCVVRDWSPGSALVSEGYIQRVSVVCGDIRDQALLERVCGDYEIDTMIHLAAQTTVPVATRNPVETFDSNIRGTWTMLEAARRSPLVTAVVMASSDKAYGAAKTLPYRESMPLDAIHPYDVSKACSDLISRTYAATFGLPVAVTRSGNFFGGGDLNWNRVIPGTIRSALRGRAPVIRSDGTPLRDYVYVEDVVEAYLLLAEAVADGRVSGVGVNISYERPLSVLELVNLVLRELGSDLEPIVQGSAQHEIQDQYLDATWAREQLGWRPRFSLEEGIRRTIEWYRIHLRGADAGTASIVQEA